MQPKKQLLAHPVIAIVILVVLNGALLTGVIMFWPKHGFFGGTVAHDGPGSAWRHDPLKSLEDARKSFRDLEKKEGKDSKKLITALESLADHEFSEGHQSTACGLYKRALHLRSQHNLPDDEQKVTTLVKFAECIGYESDYAAADEAYRKAIAISEKLFGESDARIDEIRVALVQSYMNRDEFQKAESEAARYVAIAHKAHRREDARLSQALQSLLQIQTRQERFDDAEKSLKQLLALQERELGPSSHEVANILTTYASLDLDRKRFADAELKLARALKIFETSMQWDAYDHRRAATYRYVANIEASGGQQINALIDADIAIIAKKAGEDSDDMRDFLGQTSDSFAYSNFEGKPLSRIDEFAKSGRSEKIAMLLDDRLEALNTRRFGRQSEQSIQARIKRAEHLRRFDKPAKAVELLKQCLKDAKEKSSDDSALVCQILAQIGSTYQDEENYAQAEAFYKEALAHAKDNAVNEELGGAFDHLISNYELWGKNELAVKFSQDKVKSDEERNDTESLGSDLMSLAHYQRLAGRLNEAEKTARSAMEHLSKKEEKDELVNNQKELASILREKKDPQWRQVFDQVCRFHEDRIAQALKKSTPAEISSYYQSFASVLTEFDEEKRSEENLRKALAFARSPWERFTLESSIAQSLVSQERNKEAEQLYLRLIESAAKDKDIADQAGFVYEEYSHLLATLGKKKESQIWAKKAIEANKNAGG